MVITQIKKIDQNKSKIYIDDQYAFVLYKNEIYNNGIRENEIIYEDKYQYLYYHIILKRAKKKALSLLQRKEQTEYELCQKLERHGYNQDIIQQTIEYIHKFSYINHERYVRNYIRNKSGSKSNKVMELELQQRGISRECIQEIFQELEIDTDERDLIEKLINKKIRNTQSPNKQKICIWLISKGFKSRVVLEVLDEILQN